MPAWSWCGLLSDAGLSPRAEFGTDARDDDRGIARPHAGRAEDDDAVAHARVVRVDWRIAVLQALDERAGGQAEHGLVDRKLDRRRAFVFLVDEGDRRTVHSRKAVSDLRAGREPAPAPFLRILLEEELSAVRRPTISSLPHFAARPMPLAGRPASLCLSNRLAGGLHCSK